MKYKITKIEENPVNDGVHVETEFERPDGVVEDLQVNFGPETIKDDAWKSMLDEIIQKRFEHFEKKKLPGAKTDTLSKFLGEHEITPEKEKD